MGKKGPNCTKPDFGTINAAVRKATAGDTIYVCPGVYRESVNIDKNLTLEGAQFGTAATSGRTVASEETTIKPRTGNAFTYSGAVTDGTLDGFTIMGLGNNNGIVALDPTFATASWKNNILSNMVSAMNFYVSGSATITGNRFTGNDPVGNEGAIFLTNEPSKDVTIDGNAFSGNGVAVNTPGSPANSQQTSGLQITHNTSVDDANFLVLTNSMGTLIDSNTVTSSLSADFAGTGLYISGNNIDTTISNNTITGGLASGIGLNNQFSPLLPSSGTAITGNTIAGRTNGIRISPSTNSGPTVMATTISGNTVSGSTVDSIDVEGGTGTTLSDNSFTGASATTTTADCVDGTTGSGTAGTADTWTNNIGNSSLPSHLCNAAGSFSAVTPTRLLDTRINQGAPGPIGAKSTINLSVLGKAGVPASGVSAVVLNLTATSATNAGNITAYPAGTELPHASNLNFVKGQTIPVQVIVKVGTDGEVSLYNNSVGSVQLVADVAGYYFAGDPVVPGAFDSLTPARVLDTRVDQGGTGPVEGMTATTFQILGEGGVPTTDVSAVVLNVTAVSPAAFGHFTLYAAGNDRPYASNLNFAAGQTIANLAVVKVGIDGMVALYNGSAGPASAIADVAGYYLDGTASEPGTFVALSPSRVLNTRNNTGAEGPVAAMGTISVQIAGNGAIPDPVAAVTLNVTATNPTSDGTIRVFANGTDLPHVSNLNFVTGQTVANLATVPVADDGKIALFNGSTGTVDLIGDVAGYFLD
ncbi:MAG: right-handed parallel beta-helix repeat-containing protein [Nakamurella sp.]